MQLLLWWTELLLGTGLLWWGVHKVLRISQVLRKEKDDSLLPAKDDPINLWWLLGRGAGWVLGIMVALVLYHIFDFNGIYFSIVIFGLGEYMAEYFSQQPIAEGNPWRAAVEEMAVRLDMDPGEIRYRQGPEWAPYAGLGGITLPSYSLRKLDDTALRFALVGALLARKNRVEWRWFSGWLLLGIVPLLLYLCRIISTDTDSTIYYCLLGSLPTLFWALYAPTRIRETVSREQDRLALKLTGDLEAARSAIERMDTMARAFRRMRDLEQWWSVYQKEQALKGGTSVVLQPSNTQVHTIRQKQ